MLCCQQYILPAAALRLQRVPFFVLAAHCPPVLLKELYDDLFVVLTLLESEVEVLLASELDLLCCQQYILPAAALRLQRVPFFVIAAHRPSVLPKELDEELFVELTLLELEIEVLVSNLCADVDNEVVTTMAIAMKNLVNP